MPGRPHTLRLNRASCSQASAPAPTRCAGAQPKVRSTRTAAGPSAKQCRPTGPSAASARATAGQARSLGLRGQTFCSPWLCFCVQRPRWCPTWRAWLQPTKGSWGGVGGCSQESTKPREPRKPTDSSNPPSAAISWPGTPGAANNGTRARERRALLSSAPASAAVWAAWLGGRADTARHAPPGRRALLQLHIGDSSVSSASSSGPRTSVWAPALGLLALAVSHGGGDARPSAGPALSLAVAAAAASWSLLAMPPPVASHNWVHTRSVRAALFHLLS